MPTAATIEPVQPARFRNQTLLRVARPNSAHLVWISRGKPGSLHTAAEMANLVREDVVRDEGLERWAAQIVINSGLNSHSRPLQVIESIFNYVQQLDYIHDPGGPFDSINSARQVLAKGYGDCDDLSVLLATLLALVGFRPAFVLARYKEKSRGFDHVYVEVETKDGPIPLDPSARDHGAGWESRKWLDRVVFPIFAKPPSNGLGFLPGAGAALATGGAFGPVGLIVSIGSILAPLIAGLFGRTARNKPFSDQRDIWKEQVYQAMDQIQQAVDSCQATPAQGMAAAQQLVQQYYQACDASLPTAIAKSCRNFETQDYPGGAQQGGFKTHEAKIQASGKSCPAGTPGSGSLSVLGGAGGLSLPVLIAIGAGAYFLLRR